MRIDVDVPDSAARAVAVKAVIFNGQIIGDVIALDTDQGWVDIIKMPDRHEKVNYRGKFVRKRLYGKVDILWRDRLDPSKDPND